MGLDVKLPAGLISRNASLLRPQNISNISNSLRPQSLESSRFTMVDGGLIPEILSYVGGVAPLLFLLGGFQDDDRDALKSIRHTPSTSPSSSSTALIQMKELLGFHMATYTLLANQVAEGLPDNKKDELNAIFHKGAREEAMEKMKAFILLGYAEPELKKHVKKFLALIMDQECVNYVRNKVHEELAGMYFNVKGVRLVIAKVLLEAYQINLRDLADATAPGTFGQLLTWAQQIIFRCLSWTLVPDQALIYYPCYKNKELWPFVGDLWFGTQGFAQLMKHPPERVVQIEMGQFRPLMAGFVDSSESRLFCYPRFDKPIRFREVHSR